VLGWPGSFQETTELATKLLEYGDLTSAVELLKEKKRTEIKSRGQTAR